MVNVKPFGATKIGQPVTCISIQNKNKACVELLDYGCIIRSLLVPSRDGGLVDVVLGYDSVEEYQNNRGNYFGAAVGRHANRIGKGRFVLNEKTYTLALNNGENHLHGGDVGFSDVFWSYAVTGDNSVTFARTSPDGEEGYPGNLETRVSYTLTDTNELVIRYEAVSDADTVVNLTNHSYFNLGGKGDVLAHQLRIDAQAFTPNDSGCLPTGELRPVEGTPFDFRQPKAIGQEIASGYEQVAMFGGYDHNFVLGGSGLRTVAELHLPENGIVMETRTTKPGVQLYTANALAAHAGKGGATYGKHSAACLETQFFPNAMTCTNFPSPVLRAGERYDHTTVYAFSVR